MPNIFFPTHNSSAQSEHTQPSLFVSSQSTQPPIVDLDSPSFSSSFSFSSPLSLPATQPTTQPATQPTTQNRTPETTRTIDLLQQTPEKPRIPWTPPKATGDKAVDRANLRAFRERRNQIFDRHTKIRREKEVRDKLRQQAAKEAAEEEKRRKKTEKQAELDRRRQELERALPPKRRLMRAVKARLKELEAEAYPLLLAIKERMQHHATSNTPKHSYNHIIMDEATQSAMEEQRKHTQPGVRCIYSNGSMVNLGKARCSMAFVVVEQQPVIQGTVKRFASS